jgi:hypothetical protein
MLYSSEKYHPVQHNCIDFALTACHFLGVPLQAGFHIELNNWLKEQYAIFFILKFYLTQKLQRFNFQFF